MKIAVTYEKDTGNVFQHFGHTEYLKIYNIENNNIEKEQIINVNGQGHGALATLLSNNSVEILICGGIGSGAIESLEKLHIKYYAGVTGNSDEAIKNFLNNSLVYNKNPKCNHHDSSNHSCHNHECNEDKHGCSSNH